VENGNYLCYDNIYTLNKSSNNEITLKNDTMINGLRICRNDGKNYCKILDETILSETISDEDISKFSIITCRRYSCFKTVGYIKYKSDGTNNNIAKCSLEGCEKIELNDFECNEYTSELAYYDTNESVFKLCTNYKNGYEFQKTTNDSYTINYIIHRRYSYYFIYKTNKDKSIIAQNKIGINFFYFIYYYIKKLYIYIVLNKYQHFK